MITDLFNRYIWLVDTIYSAGSISREAINCRWQRSRYNIHQEACIPERTFHRDREAIALLFNVDIECDKTHNLYSIANIDDIQQDGLRRWMVASFAVKQMIDESGSLRDRIIYEEIPSGQQELTKFVAAMRDSLRVRITHRNYKGEPSYSTLISPYCLKVFKQRWYVAGVTDRYPDEIRVYALDRLSDVTLTETTFELEEGFSAQHFFQYSYGVYQSDQPVDILIRVAKQSVPFLDSVPLHASQRKIKETADDALYQFHLAPMFDFKQQLRSLGADVEVIEPASFRQEFIDDLHALLHTYHLD